MRAAVGEPAAVDLAALALVPRARPATLPRNITPSATHGPVQTPVLTCRPARRSARPRRRGRSTVIPGTPCRSVHQVGGRGSRSRARPRTIRRATHRLQQRGPRFPAEMPQLAAIVVIRLTEAADCARGDRPAHRASRSASLPRATHRGTCSSSAELRAAIVTPAESAERAARSTRNRRCRRPATTAWRSEGTGNAKSTAASPALNTITETVATVPRAGAAPDPHADAALRRHRSNPPTASRDRIGCSQLTSFARQRGCCPSGTYRGATTTAIGAARRVGVRSRRGRGDCSASVQSTQLISLSWQ